ncbi:hypothetical protein [Piscirickettsia litoralis]|uniref:Glycerophosphoryl diester phosphodiesterase membrane domain-containing protein n=1 Tax=Piscirickettsia litoralis TaxID=1891921 RepID=A0ABX3A307_9GAMM|nr:hypothetical protein [Piscirickettsia litoralis]ODN42622.1 hypothetical protein BGC07_06385 [Piscirickettsia litoralis]
MSDQNKVPAVVIFQRAWGLYKHAFTRLFPIAFATFALMALYKYTIMTQFASSSSVKKAITAIVISQLVFICILAFSQNAQLFTLKERYMNADTPFSAIAKNSAARFISMLVLTLILFVVIQLIAGFAARLVAAVLPSAIILIYLLIVLISVSFVFFAPCILLFEKQSIIKSILLSIQRSKPIWRSNFFLLLPPLLAYMLLTSILTNINLSVESLSAAGLGVEEVITIFADAAIFPFLMTLIFTQYTHYLPKTKSTQEEQNNNDDPLA